MNNYTGGIITDEEVFNFVNTVVNNENYLLQKNYERKDLSQYFTIKSREQDKIIVFSNYDTGISKYNVFYLTKKGFSSLFKLCSEIKDRDYNNKVWMRILKVKNVKNLEINQRIVKDEERII